MDEPARYRPRALFCCGGQHIGHWENRLLIGMTPRSRIDQLALELHSNLRSSEATDGTEQGRFPPRRTLQSSGPEPATLCASV